MQRSRSGQCRAVAVVAGVLVAGFGQASDEAAIPSFSSALPTSSVSAAADGFTSFTDLSEQTKALASFDSYPAGAIIIFR